MLDYLTDPDHLRLQWFVFCFILICFCLGGALGAYMLDEHKQNAKRRRFANENRRFSVKRWKEDLR